MKYKIRLLIFLCSVLFAKTLVAQNNTLIIDIGNNALSIKYEGKTINDGESFKANTRFWSIAVKKSTNINYTLALVNGADKKLDVTSFPTNFAVDSSKIKAKDFEITPSFRVVLMQGTTEKVTHTLEFSSALARRGSSAPEGSVYRYGSAVRDANYLNNGANSKYKRALLAHYANCDTSLSEIKKAYADNKFLPPAEIERLINVIGAQSKAGDLAKKAISAAGGLDVTNIADGLARFLVKRTKEELNIAFFDDLRKFLNKPEFRDLQTVFPETHRTFVIIGDEVYNIERYIETLRESFRSDLGNLTTNLRTIVDNHPLFFEKYPELRGTLFSGLYVAESIRDKVHPGDILNEYETGCPECLDDLKGPTAASIQTLRLFSESLKDSITSDTSYWVSSRVLKSMLKDTVVTRYYFGLVAQLAKSRYNSIPLTADTTFVKVLNGFGPQTQQAYQTYLLRYIDKTEKLTKMIKTYTKPANDSLMLEQYYNYFKTTVDLLEYSVEVSKLPYMPAKLGNLKALTKDYLDIANSCADLTLDINRKNYASAVRNAVHIYDVIKARRAKAHEDALKPQVDSLTAQVKTLSKGTDAKQPKPPALMAAENNLAEVKTEYESERVAQSIKEKLFKYGTFMASLVNADSPEEAQAVIESFALPTGSARIKRETEFNVSLNGYVGLYMGNERIRGLEDSGEGTYGLMAPVGVSISFGHRFLVFNTGKSGWSTSLFLSVIDLGAVASFRFTNESVPVDGDTATVHALPQIKLKDIISPGAFLSIGIPKSPLSVNVGWQIGPNLRKVSLVSDTGVIENAYSDQMYNRFSVSLVVDIPIVNFYSKSRN